jgi:hypothetical protein
MNCQVYSVIPARIARRAAPVASAGLSWPGLASGLRRVHWVCFPPFLQYCWLTGWLTLLLQWLDLRFLWLTLAQGSNHPTQTTHLEPLLAQVTNSTANTLRSASRFCGMGKTPPSLPFALTFSPSRLPSQKCPGRHTLRLTCVTLPGSRRSSDPPTSTASSFLLLLCRRFSFSPARPIRLAETHSTK